jgi:hypothetical protein
LLVVSARSLRLNYDPCVLSQGILFRDGKSIGRFVAPELHFSTAAGESRQRLHRLVPVELISLVFESWLPVWKGKACVEDAKPLYIPVDENFSTSNFRLQVRDGGNRWVSCPHTQQRYWRRKRRCGVADALVCMFASQVIGKGPSTGSFAVPFSYELCGRTMAAALNLSVQRSEYVRSHQQRRQEQVPNVVAEGAVAVSDEVTLECGELRKSGSSTLFSGSWMQPCAVAW